MERAERMTKLRAKGLTYREIARQNNLSVGRVFNIIREYNHRLKLIKQGNWSYGLTTRAKGALDALNVWGMDELVAFMQKHGEDLPSRVKYIGPKIFAELKEFVKSKA